MENSQTEINGVQTEAAKGSSFIERTSGLKLPEYIGYAFGDLGGCLVFGLVTSLLQKFYTDIFQLNPLWIMVMMVAARLWDAINDPMMGRIADSVKVGNNGRYRRWLIWASIPLAVSSILMFVKWPGLGDTPDHTGTFIYATITYIMFGMSYTMAQIPYGSLASVITTDEGERNKLSIFRSAGAGVGSIPVMAIASFCYIKRVDAAGKNVLGENGKVIEDMVATPVLIGAIVLSLLMILAYYFCYRLTTERVQTAPAENREKGETKKVLKALFTNRAFISISIASMLMLAAQMFTQSFNLYLFSDYFGKGWLNLVSTACTYAPMVVLMFFTPKLVRKFGKKELCGIGMAIAAAAQLLMFAFRGLMPDAWWLYMILCFISGCGQTFVLLQVWSVATDAIDDIEVKTGIREDGTAYSAFTFFRKLGQMLAAIVVNGALLAMNYKYEKGAVQSWSSLLVMYDLATIIPAVLFGIMAVVLFIWYPLNKRKTQELQLLKEEKLKEQYESNAIGIASDSAE